MISSTLLSEIGGCVAGRWVRARQGQGIEVINPATGEVLADVPDMGAAETTAAIDASAASLEHDHPPEQRRQWLSRLHELMMLHQRELARIITLEQGKPLKESLVEVEYSAGFFRFFSEQLAHLNSEQLPQKIRNLKWTLHHRPAGVVGLITPWNFPLAMLTKKLAPALAAGCAVVAKPSELTPLSAIALWKLAEEAGVPAGRMNLVIGRPEPIGDTLCAHLAVRLISFTGSTPVGKHLIARTAPHVKRLALELGGNAPYIVFSDADITVAAAALMANKFRCAGQTCVCANRVYVQRSVVESFLFAISERVRRLRLGNGVDEATDIGPLINRSAFDKVARHVKDALSRGARRIVGADRERPANDFAAFYDPTVLADTNSEMLLSREETFGPVVAVGAFDSDDEAIQLANGTPFGLAAYVFTDDPARAQRVVSRLRFGHVGINTGMGPTPEAPFGGMKQSGFGREGGVEGLLEFCETQTVASP
ncbi:MAG: NAD-dependent succinate-semialdehyde dehydrogenase [Tepidisphaeraceae bacterium]